MSSLEERVGRVVGDEVVSLSPLSGGCVGEVYRARTRRGLEVVAKVDERGQGTLAVEGRMLEDLAAASELPVPKVLAKERDLLVMELLPGATGASGRAELHAADLLAGLHDVEGERFGYPYDTLIGGLAQPNPESSSWIPFFRDHRLLYMADEAHAAGRLPARVRSRVDVVAARIDELLEEPRRPSLIHGDVWSGNVLSEGGRVTGLLDPAIYFAHPEVELAFITLFHTFGDAFFRRYQERRELRPGFFEERRHLYNLYPLLVHVRLFGGGYVGQVESVLSRFGA